MQTLDQQTAIETAIAVLDKANPHQTYGKWLENLTVDVGPFIKDWNLAQCWHWTEWPEREQEAARLHRAGHRNRRRRG